MRYTTIPTGTWKAERPVTACIHDSMPIAADIITQGYAEAPLMGVLWLETY